MKKYFLVGGYNKYILSAFTAFFVIFSSTMLLSSVSLADSSGSFWNKKTIVSGSVEGQFQGEAVLDKKVYLFGGYKDGIFLNTIRAITYGSNGIAVAETNAPWSGRSGIATAVFKGKIYVAGGFDGGSLLNDVWLMPKDGSWTEVTQSAPWSARTGAAMFVFSDKLWIVGGMSSGRYKNDIWSSSDGATWDLVSDSLPWSARADMRIVEFKNKIWLLGGRGQDGNSNDIWSSSDGTNWTEEVVDASWHGDYGIHTVATQDKIYLMADGDGGYIQNDLWSSNNGITWKQEIAFQPFSFISGYSLSALNGQMLLIGGKDYSSDYLDSIYSYPISESYIPFTKALLNIVDYDGSRLTIPTATTTTYTVRLEGPNKEPVEPANLSFRIRGLSATDPGIDASLLPRVSILATTETNSFILTLTIPDNSYIDENYGIILETTNDQGESGPSSILKIVVTSPALPTEPKDLIAVAGEPGSNLINLNWATSTDVDFYKIFRGTLAGGEILLATTTVDNVPYIDEGANAGTSGTTYFYQVIATSAGGDSATSSEVSAKSLPPPGHPTLITSNPTDLADIKINTPTKLQWVIDDQDHEPLNYIVNWGDTLQDTGVLKPTTILADCVQMVGQSTSCGSGATLYEPLTLTHAWSAAGNYSVLLAIGGTLGDPASSKITLQVLDTATLVDLINTKLSAASTPLSAKNINDFNSTSQELKADFTDSQNISHGYIDINFPKDSLYGVSGSPTVTLQAISNNELNNALTPSPLSQIPPNLEQLTDYVFGFQVLSDKNLDILKSNIPIRLQLNNISDITKWGSARLYQYVCIDYNLDTELCLKHAWVPISEKAAVTKVNALLEAKTLDTRLGLIAIFGQK